MMDNMSEDGATHLASCVLAYWLDRGHFAVDVRIERDAVAERRDRRHAVWVVRSNLVGGLPR